MKLNAIIACSAVAVLAGCGTTGKFVYPAKMSTMFKSEGGVGYDKVVAVMPFDDYRSDENSSAGYWLYMLPLCPWGRMEYDRPDAANFFVSIEKYDATPSEDLAKATATSIRQSRMFKDAYFTMGGDKDRADYVISGRIKEMKYTGKVYSYGLSVLGPALWYVGAPAGNSECTISYELEMRNRDGKIVWEYAFKRSADIMQWLYYRYGHDCKEFPSIYQTSMNEALANLASKMNSQPDAFK